MIPSIKKSILYILFLSVFCSTFFVVPYVKEASAVFNTPIELSGYAWSDTIGWISLNCRTGGPTGNNICASRPYHVQIETDKDLTGYAWSDNIGWIKFGGLSAQPAAGGNARIVGSNALGWSLAGWIRACAGTVTGNCSSMTNSIDGWDGWISLNCTNISGACASANYGVAVGDGSFNGYAWGSSVVGWVTFQFVTFVPPCVAGNTCSIDFLGTIYTNMWCESDPVDACVLGQVCTTANPVCALIVIDGVLTANPLLVRKTNTSQLTWSVANPLEVASCQVLGTNGETFTGTSGSNVTTAPLTFEKTVYTLSCIPFGGGPLIDVASTSIRTLPNVSET
jgi:hypothetical protein